MTNYSLILGRNFSVNCNFTCEITKLPWQPFRTSQCQFKMATKFCYAVNEDVRAQKDTLENLNTQENIKKDSNRYFAEKV